MSTKIPDGVAAPEYYVMQPGEEFVVGLPDATHLKICAHFDAPWEIIRYDDQTELNVPIERVQIRRFHPVPGEPTEPIQPSKKN